MHTSNVNSMRMLFLISPKLFSLMVIVPYIFKIEGLHNKIYKITNKLFRTTQELLILNLQNNYIQKEQSVIKKIKIIKQPILT